MTWALEVVLVIICPSVLLHTLLGLYLDCYSKRNNRLDDVLTQQRAQSKSIGLYNGITTSQPQPLARFRALHPVVVQALDTPQVEVSDSCTDSSSTSRRPART